MSILYLSSVLPKRSETFVYREVLGLRAAGLSVAVASLYPPERNLGDPALEALAGEVVPVYGAGAVALGRDALAFAGRHPGRAWGVLWRAGRDALGASDVRGRGRLKIPLQAVAALALARRLGGRDITHLHVHMAHAAATVGMYAARALGVPFSFTGHAADLFRDRSLLREKLARAAFVVCISHWHRDWYGTLVPRPAAEYPVVRCGVDLPASVDRSEPEDAGLRVLGVGRLVPKKGFDLLVEAGRLLAAEGCRFAMTIAGDGPEREALERLADGLPVRFCGAVNHAEVPALLAEADVVVLPCRIGRDQDRDGIPVVLMEAMAHRVCVVSGDLPAIRELVQDGTNGLLIPPGDTNALAQALLRLAREPGWRLRLAGKGRERVEEEFSSTRNIARLLALFRTAL